MTPKKFTWKEAMKAVDELNKNKHEGHENWRLPSVEELTSIIDYTKHNPACKLSDMVAARYWSATPFAGNTFNAWLVNFNGGDVYNSNKTNNNYARLVRSGPNGLEWGETL